MNQDVERYIEIMQRRRKSKSERYYLDLQPNEVALLDAAARIYAAYVTSGQVGGPETADQFVARAVHEAAKLAYTVERSVADAEESRPTVE